MSSFPKKLPKKVIINEDYNTYHDMIDEDGDLNAIAAEVKNLLDIEETSDVSKESQLSELEKLKKDQKSIEQKIEFLARKSGLRKKNIDLGESYMLELTDTTIKIRETFQSVSNSLQQRKEVLLSVHEIDQFIKDQSYLNNLSLERLQSNYNKKIENQENCVERIEEEIDRLKVAGEENVEGLGKRFDALSEELSVRNVEIGGVDEELEVEKKRCGELGARFVEVKRVVGEAGLDLQEVHLKREEMGSELEVFEGVYAREIKELTEKNQLLSGRLSQENEECAKLENNLKIDKSTFDDQTNTRKQLEDEIAIGLENINQFKASIAELDEQKNGILTNVEVKRTEKQNTLTEIQHQLEEELTRKNFELEESNQRKQHCEYLKTELDGLLKTIESTTDCISKENKTIEEISRENSSLDEANPALVNHIQQLQKAIEDTKMQNAGEDNAFNSSQLELQKSIQELKESLIDFAENHQARYEELKKQFAEETDELDKTIEGEVFDLKKSIEELRSLEEECAESVKVLESNFDGIRSECDVISRKILVQERNLVDEKRRRRAPAPVMQKMAAVKKPAYDAMSDSSDDAPNALDILARKRELQMKKASAKRSRNK